MTSPADWIATLRSWWISLVYRHDVLGVGLLAMFGLAVLLAYASLGLSRPRGPGHDGVLFDVSPDGTSLVFSAAGKGKRDLFLMDVATCDVTSLGPTAEYEHEPRFSADGKSVVYSANTGDYADYLFVRPISGGTPRQLTNAGFNDRSACFSPDGSRILFLRQKQYVWGGKVGFQWYGAVLCEIQPDGAGFRELLLAGIEPLDVRISRTRESAFVLGWAEPGSPIHLYEVQIGNVPDAQRATVVQNNFSWDGGWAISPDGELVALTSGRYSQDVQILIKNADGSEARPLNPSINDVTDIAFRPDASGLFFCRQEWPSGPTGESSRSLWQVDLDGKNAKRVADSGLFSHPLTWKPSRPGE